MSVFELVKQEEKKAKEISRISFRSPFAQTDFILLLTAATFKVAASRVNYDLQSILNDILVADSYQV
jgi:predicted transcriptional regulator